MTENKALEKALQDYQQEALETLRAWVRLPSVKAEGAGNAPFGQDTRKMLDRALEDCRRLGFDVEDIDGYAGQADMGEGDPYDALGILGHLDVVPVGDNWEHDPFGAELIDGRVYGRGTSDDKGPVVAALYAMAAVKKAGIPLKRRVRLIMGCDEETGMDDMAYYQTHAVMPRMGFSPDAEYPVINIEKGGCHVILRGAMNGEGMRLKRFRVGERINVIPGIAQAEVYGGQTERDRAVRAAEALGFPLEAVLTDEGTVRLSTVGKPGHAAMGEEARNAIGQMLLILRDAGMGGAIASLADTVGMTYYGEKLGISMEDGVSGKLTCALDIINGDEKQVTAQLDIRYPVLMKEEAMMRVMNDTLNGRLTAELAGSHTPHFVSENSTLVQELLAAYEDVTGCRGKALAIGGGTYARTMEEGVAFGALFPGEEELAHQANEYITVEDLYRNMRIFAYAIVRMAGK